MLGSGFCQMKASCSGSRTRIPADPEPKKIDPVHGEVEICMIARTFVHPRFSAIVFADGHAFQTRFIPEWHRIMVFHVAEWPGACVHRRHDHAGVQPQVSFTRIKIAWHFIGFGYPLKMQAILRNTNTVLCKCEKKTDDLSLWRTWRVWGVPVRRIFSPCKNPVFFTSRITWIFPADICRFSYTLP